MDNSGLSRAVCRKSSRSSGHGQYIEVAFVGSVDDGEFTRP